MIRNYFYGHVTFVFSQQRTNDGKCSKYFTVSEVGRRHIPHDSSGVPRRAHTDRFPNTITTDLCTLSDQPQRRRWAWTVE